MRRDLDSAPFRPFDPLLRRRGEPRAGGGVLRNVVSPPDTKIVGAAAAIVPQDDAFLFGRSARGTGSGWTDARGR
jgi:hypothetical protein